MQPNHELTGGPPGECVGRFALEPRAALLAGCRRELRTWLADRGCAAELVDDLCLASNEAMANAVEHATGSELIEVVIRLADDRVDIEVSNAGAWTDRPVPRPYRGRGLELMQTLMDVVDIRTDRGRVAISMRRQLAPGALQEPPPESDQRPTSQSQRSGVGVRPR